MNKTKINFMIDMFAKLATAIFIFSSLYIFAFGGFDSVISVKYIWGVLAQSFLLTVAFLPFLSEKEMSKKKFLFCNIIYFIFADIVVLVSGLFLHWFSLEHPVTIIAMEIVFVLVYVSVYILMYFSSKRSVDKMNQQLKKMKQEK
ncbi:MAG: DUF3021 domain-containing protein [Treponema sp.]|nr:DUF3021 domain-containing protein [Treponema sp.]